VRCGALPHRGAEPGEHLSAGKAATLAADGQLALDAGDHRSAVVAFRKWAYLSPDDPLAHLHLGLAFQAAGDLDSARRAYAVARRIVTTDRGPAEHAIGGFATSEFIKLVDMKNGEMGR
jgi:Tfp pilus assembly protein PilF